SSVQGAFALEVQAVDRALARIYSERTQPAPARGVRPPPGVPIVQSAFETQALRLQLFGRQHEVNPPLLADSPVRRPLRADEIRCQDLLRVRSVEGRIGAGGVVLAITRAPNIDLPPISCWYKLHRQAGSDRVLEGEIRARRPAEGDRRLDTPRRNAAELLTG